MKKSTIVKTMSACAASIAIGALPLFLSCTEENGMSNAFLEQRKESADYVTDARDGKQYRTVKVGSLTWTAENINYRTVNSHCYGGIDANCEKYGRLYDWQDAAFSACPAGWHLPTTSELNDLKRTVGEDIKSLKARTWGGTDKYGWTALPGGYIIGDENAYGALEKQGWWWVAEYDPATHRSDAMVVEWGESAKNYLIWKDAAPEDGQSVRCVKDDGNTKRFSISFNTNGGTPDKIDDATINSGRSLYNSHYDLANLWPEREGYRLAGWSDGRTTFYLDSVALEPITRNITLTAQWERAFNVYFRNNDSTFMRITVDNGKSISDMYGNINDWYTFVAKPGYILEGWFYGNTEYTQETPITADVTLTAKWRQLPKYTMTFDLNGGTLVKYDKVPTVPMDSGRSVMEQYGGFNDWYTFAAKPGYILEGWFDGNTECTQDTKINADITLTAKWRAVPKYTVTFNTNGGTPSTIPAVPIDSGSALGTLPANPTKSGYFFGGWFDGNTQYNAQTVITKTVTLTAKWSETRKYTVSFNTNGGTPSTISPVQADSGSAFGTYMPTAPTRSGYFFEGWADGTTKYTAQTVIVKNVTLTATWRQVPKFTVSFDANGGTLSTINSIQIDSGSAIGSNMPTPTKIGYHFGGWFDGTTQYTATTPITKTVTLSAQWNTVSKFTVSFNTDGGTPTVSSVQADSGSALGANFPTAKPVKAGYLFLGWYDGNTKYTQQTVIAKNVTLIAKYELMALEYGEFTDERDDMVYHKVRIGGQTWMAENLNYQTSGSLCPDGRADNCTKYGRLYEWMEVMKLDSYYDGRMWDNDVLQQGICPTGWHLPSRQEWQTLEDELGGAAVAGAKLKSIRGWGNNGNGTDIYNFSAMPAGYSWITGVCPGTGHYCHDELSYHDVEYTGYWWTATESNSWSVYYRSISASADNISELSQSKSSQHYTYSVRCVQD